jgi:outer membrane protein assembly factor BamB
MNPPKAATTGLIILLTVSRLLAAPSAEEQAAQILAATGVKGGLVVHVGCAAGRLTAALRANDSYLVQGLDSDPKNVTTVRMHIRSKGLYGPVSVDRFDGTHLPFADGVVNLLVASGPPLPEGSGAANEWQVTGEEIARVLAPRGVAVLARQSRPNLPELPPLATSHSPLGEDWLAFRKPVPNDIDDWTHYLHDPSNNAVGHDARVGPPKHLRWVGSPSWTRHHDHMSSFNAMVSANGRVFYVIDLGLRAEVQLPADWALVARDAFSGVVLWQRSIDTWHTQLWPLKSGPAQLPRRLVAVGDAVYVTLGLGEPVAALDAATGKTIRTYDGTEGAEEILCADGTLYLVAAGKPTSRPWSTRETYASFNELRPEPETWAWKPTPRRVMAVDARTGKTIWEVTSPIVPMTLTVAGRRVYVHDGKAIRALDRAAGEPLWTSAPLKTAGQIRSWFAPTLVVSDDVVVFAGGEKMLRHKGGIDSMTALSAKTGKTLWTAPHPPSGYDSPEDVFVIDGIVWTAPTTNKRDTGKFTGHDLRTGKVVRSFPADDGTHMPHHRCHRAKATDKYIVASRTGIEYVDLEAEHWNRNDWVRGACLYGVVPANGLTYATPHSCACYIIAKLNGLNALAAERQGAGVRSQESERLEKGSAFGAAVRHSGGHHRETRGWPTFRGDMARSGCTPTQVPVELRRAWKADLGGRLSSPVVARGMICVADIDRHSVYALEAASGEPIWTFTAGGRIDSPPTVARGCVFFGSADGHVYCLRAAEGGLIWRFRAAPEDLRLTAWEQVESVWPLHGSVLVIDDVVHAVAGRSMFLDGGLRYVRLRADTGELLSENVMDRRNPVTGKALDAGITWPNLPVALPDVLSYDGRYVYMRSQRFDTNGKRVGVTKPTDHRDQKGAGAHLFSPTGFLDDSWWHRTYWLYGKSPLSAAGGWYKAAYAAPAGRIMVCDASRVYAFGRRPQYFPRTTALEYHLYAAKKAPGIVPLNPKASGAGSTAAKRRRLAPSRPVYDWSRTAPVLGRALVKAGETLFVAGPPDVVDQEATLAAWGDPASAAALAEQRDAYLGMKGGILLAASAADGRKRGAYRLESVPVFDGMAAANGCLYLANMDGSVVCLSGEGDALKAADIEVEDTPPAMSGGAAPIAMTSRHPEFQHVNRVKVASCALGWHLRTTSGGVGLALRKLEKPLTGMTTFKLRVLMHPNVNKDPNKPPPGNAFLAFGDGTDDGALIKCGLRSAGQSGSIVEGPLLKGSITSQKVVCKVKEPIDIEVSFNPATQRVRMTVLGEIVETTLKRRLDRITHVGYAIQSVVSEFGPVEMTSP